MGDEVISGSTKDEDLVRPTEKIQKKQALTNEDVEEELPLEEDAEDIKVLPVVEEEEELEDRDILEEKEEEEDLEVPLEKEELKVKEKGAPVKKATNRTNNAAFFTSVSESEHEVTMMAGAGRGHKGKGNLRGEIEKEEKEIEKEEKEIEKNVEDHH